MEKIILERLAPRGLPLYELRKLFASSGEFTHMSFSHITLLPGMRVPESGESVHAEDEYSFFLDGEVYTVSGGYEGVCGAGEGTLIPKGERHWCENRTDRPCTLVCVMVK